MMKMNRRRYPANWPELALACKVQAGWKCEHCGVEQFAIRIGQKTGSPYLVYLHAAHVDHDPRNLYPRLRALCPACHMRYDYEHKQREARITLERLRHRMMLQARGLLVLVGGAA